MRLSFDSIDEVKEFVKSFKGTRGGKNEPDEAPAAGQAPTPLMPPAGGFAGPGSATGFPAAGGAFPTTAAPAIDPALQGVVTRIVTKLDASLAAGRQRTPSTGSMKCSNNLSSAIMRQTAFR